MLGFYFFGIILSAKRRRMAQNGFENPYSLSVQASAALHRLSGVVCGRGRNPTLRLWPAIFSGEIDVFPSERRNMGQEIGR